MTGSDGDDHMMGHSGSYVFLGSAGSDMIMGNADDYDQVDYAGTPQDYAFHRNDDGSVTVMKPDGTDTLMDIDGIWFNGSGDWMSLDALITERPQQPETPDEVDPADSVISGTEGNDYLFGTDGNDVIDLGLGLDVANGSAGNDTIIGGDNGYNQVDYDGGPQDYAFYRNDDGSVTVQKPNGTDTLTDIGGIWFKGSAQWLSIDVLIANSPEPQPGNSGDDYIVGTNGDDYIDAGAGVDVVRGSEGNDVIDGGGDEYDQVDYAGSIDDYAIVAKDGGYQVTKNNGEVDMLFDIDGIWFSGSNEWNYIEDLAETEYAA